MRAGFGTASLQDFGLGRGGAKSGSHKEEGVKSPGLPSRIVAGPGREWTDTKSWDHRLRPSVRSYLEDLIMLNVINILIMGTTHLLPPGTIYIGTRWDLGHTGSKRYYICE